MTMPKQHAAVNHLRKFLDEEFALGRGHVQATAFLRAYEWWCLSREVKNRRLSAVELLDRMEHEHGVTLRNCRTMKDGEERFVYALTPIRFRRDDSLNWRLRYVIPDTLRDQAREARNQAYELERRMRTKKETDR